MEPKRLLKNLVALAVIGLLFYLVDLRELWTVFSGLTWQYIVLLLLVSVVLIYLSSLKWNLFLEKLAFRVSVLSLFNLYLVGYFVNLILPSYVGGDAVRSFYVGKRVGQYEAFTATILERGTGIAAMMFLAVCFIWLSPLVTWQIKTVVFLFAIGFGAVLYLALSPRAMAWLEKLPLVGGVSSHLTRIQEGFHIAGGNPPLMAKTLLLSLVYHTFTVVNVVVAGYALGWFNVPFVDLFVVLPIILLIGSLPVSPSGLGIQEGAYYYFLQGLGATPAQAFGIGLLLRAKSYVLALAGGLVWLLIRKEGADIRAGQRDGVPQSGVVN